MQYFHLTNISSGEIYELKRCLNLLEFVICSYLRIIRLTYVSSTQLLTVQSWNTDKCDVMMIIVVIQAWCVTGSICNLRNRLQEVAKLMYRPDLN